MGSKVNTTSTAIDNRLAVTDSAVGLSSSGSGNVVSLSNYSLDGGAIDAAFKFAERASVKEEANLKSLLGVAEGTFNKSTAVLAEAYENAKGGSEVLQQVTIGMMLTIAAVAYFWLVGKK